MQSPQQCRWALAHVSPNVGIQIGELSMDKPVALCEKSQALKHVKVHVPVSTSQFPLSLRHYLPGSLF